MVYRGQLYGRTTLLSVKDTSVSLAIGSDWVAAWDLGGRLYSVWKSGHTFRRGLNGRVLHKWKREADGTGATVLNPYDARERANIEIAEAAPLVQEAADALRGVLEAMAHDLRSWSNADGCHPGARVVELCERCARFDAAAAFDDATRFRSVFAPVGILPPDQYLSIVLQATEGCSFGGCTFCDLFHEQYKVKTVEMFAQHAESVRDYLGDSARLRGRSIFLGAANALAVPMERLVEFMRTAARVFGPASRPVNAFVDGFTGLRKEAGDYAVLREHGLRRVYVGLESGHDPLLAFVRKPATRDQAIATVRAIKAGGVSVGVIVMIGLGGRRFAAAHAADTMTALDEMALGAGDLLFFSDLVEVPGTAYPQLAEAEDLGPMTLDERIAQIAEIRAGLSFAGAPPQIARYDVREFVY
jgi:hypothetical protein